MEALRACANWERTTRTAQSVMSKGHRVFHRLDHRHPHILHPLNHRGVHRLHRAHPHLFNHLPVPLVTRRRLHHHLRHTRHRCFHRSKCAKIHVLKWALTELYAIFTLMGRVRMAVVDHDRRSVASAQTVKTVDREAFLPHRLHRLHQRLHPRLRHPRRHCPRPPKGVLPARRLTTASLL